MRSVIPATVGYSSAQVGYLQRRSEDFALPYADRYNGVGRPLTEPVGVEAAVGYEAARLCGEIDAEAVAVTHLNKVILPFLKRSRCRPLAVNHILEPPAEISITRSLQRGL